MIYYDAPSFIPIRLTASAMRSLLILSLVLALLPGCGGRRAQAELDRAASLMQTHPDSALLIARSVSATGRHERARAALYRAWAGNKLQSETADDSLLAEAGRFYASDEGGTARDRMIYHYLTGMRSCKTKRYGDAVNSLLMAEELGRQLGDDLYLGLIYRYLADVFNDIYSQQNALRYSRLSYDSFCRYGDSLYIDYALCDLAAYFGSTFSYDSSLIYADRALKRAIAKGDSALAAGALRVGAVTCIKLERNDSAYKMLNSIRQMYGYANDRDIHHIGFVCLRLGKMREAQSCLEEISDHGLNNSLGFRIAEADNDYRTAFTLLLKEYYDNDSILCSIMNETANRQVAAFYSRRDAELKQKMQSERAVYRVILAFILVFAVLGAIILRQRRLLHRKELNEKMQIIQSLTESVKLYKHTIEENNESGRNKENALKEEIRGILADRFALLNRLCGEYYRSQGSASEKAAVYRRVQELIESFRKDSSTVARMRDIVNRHKSGILRDFNEDLPSASDDDSLLFLYLTVGLDSRAISVLFGIRIEAVYNRKAKLKRRIELLNTPRRDAYLNCF